ncbi:hypothetical protein FQN57_000954 [Myotisia sp. PD_48]|nr:hypothetical protein FQN57_000954 [Myotisia sp. PD_48]
MAKRKRAEQEDARPLPPKSIKTASPIASSAENVTIQIITGSYERTLHGFTATFSHLSKDDPSSDSVRFADTFLFLAHTSSIRCLALSPMPKPEHQQQDNVILATGGTDDRINLYNISVLPMHADDSLLPVPTLAGNKILENPRNRELGSLLHHSGSVTALHFPTRSKLLSAAEDNTIAITRTKDWSVVSTIKAPRPKTQGRPSGDTSAVGDAPAGVNDFAVHPSMKLMLTVGKGEKSMRLWNLVTGRKAGVLNFGREVLTAAKEGKWGSGEGRKIIWDSSGEEFAVGFERGVVVFGIDSIPKCRIVPSPPTKIHHISYLTTGISDENRKELLSISTEDGRILFYSTALGVLETPENEKDGSIPVAPLLYQLGGSAHGQGSRIKEFEILTVQRDSTTTLFVVVTCGSDGVIRLWALNPDELKSKPKNPSKAKKLKGKASEDGPPQVGKLLGSYETKNRITCMKAFVMQSSSRAESSESEGSENSEEEEESGDSESESDE